MSEQVNPGAKDESAKQQVVTQADKQTTDSGNMLELQDGKAKAVEVKKLKEKTKETTSSPALQPNTTTDNKLASKIEAVKSKQPSKVESKASRCKSARGTQSCKSNKSPCNTGCIESCPKMGPNAICDLKKFKAAIEEVQRLPGAKVCNDEFNLERLGFVFQRQVIATTSRGYVYQARGMTTVPVVCKVTLLDCCSPRVKENFLKNATRIIRFIGGNGFDPAHPCFIRVYDLFRVDLKTYIFMDEVPKQSALDLIKTCAKFSHDDARKWMASLCDAVLFIQQHGVAHRGIKIDHVLFDRSKAVKLAGWGRAVFYWDPIKQKHLKQNKEVRSACANGHMPPEAFSGPYDPSLADNWSLGVLLVALHTRRYAFKVKSRVDYASQWATFAAKHRISAVVLALLNSVFVCDPTKRASVAQIIRNAYFTAPTAELEQPKRAGANPGKSTMASSISQTGSVIDSKSDSKLDANNSSLVMSVKDGDEDSDNIEQKDGAKAATTPEPKPVTDKDVPLEEAAGSEIPKEGDENMTAAE